MLVALFEAVKVGRFVEDESAKLDEFGAPTRFPQNFKPASGNAEILCGLRTGEGFCHLFRRPCGRPLLRLVGELVGLGDVVLAEHLAAVCHHLDVREPQELRR